MVREFYVIDENNSWIASFLKGEEAIAFVEKFAKQNKKSIDDYSIQFQEKDFDINNCYVYVYEGTSRLFSKGAIFKSVEDALIWKTKYFRMKSHTLKWL